MATVSSADACGRFPLFRFIMNELQAFAARALRLLPTSLWWVLGLLVGAFFSIKLEKELFPNTPAAVQVARGMAAACAFAVPLLGVWWLWRVAGSLEHSGWRLLWYLAAAGATGLLLLLVVLGLMILL